MRKWLRPLLTIGPTFAIAVVSCLILLLVFDDTSEYSLFFFVLSLTLLIILQINYPDFSFKFRFFSRFSRTTVDYAVIACASVTFISNYFDNPIGYIATVSSIITVLFVPGWVFLRTVEYTKTPQKNGISIVLSFAISTGLSGIIFTFTSIYQVPPITLASIYLIIAIIPLVSRILIHKLKRYRNLADNTTTPQLATEYRVFDILLLIWILILFSFIISVLYPEMSKVTGLDIVRHFSESKGLLLAPDIYGSVYPWYHMILASVLQLSASPMLLFQFVTAFLSFMLILSFYIMSKVYLETLDRRAPVLATVLFSVFSGFGWRYFLEKIPDLNEVDSSMQILNLVFSGTYFDIGYGQSAWMWLWFRPGTLGMIILFASLYLLKNQSLGRNRYILTSSLLLISLIFIHISEFVVLLLFVFVISLFIPGIKLRLKETCLSIVISLAISVLFILSYPQIFSIDFTPQISVALVGLASASLVLTHFKRRPFQRMKIKVKFSHSVILMLCGLFVYLLLLLHWFIDAENFALSQVSTLYGVPLQFYPMLLGMTGIFAIVSIPIILKKYKEHPVIIFVLLFVLMICIGRSITYIGLEYGLTGYFERRMVLHVYTAASILAPIGIFAVIEYLDGPRHTMSALRKARVPTAFLMTFLVLIGTLSLFLSIEYQISFVKKYAIADSQIETVQEHVNKKPYSALLTLSSSSNNIAQFSSPGYLIGYWSNQMWPSKSPELSLNILSILNSSSIYLQGKDRQILTDRYQDGYLDHILGVTPAIYENNTEEIFHLPMISPAASTSSTVLVLPDYGEVDRSSFFAYDILSVGGYNYTTAFLSDISTLSNAKTLVAPSESIGTKIAQYKEDYDLKYENLIVLNLDGHGNWMNITSLSAYDLLNTDTAQGNSSNYLMNWITSSSGHGNIGTPKVENGAFDNPLSGRKASKMTVGHGNSSLWQISKDLLDTPLNLTNLDFVQFDWYGRGDGKWYAIQFTSNTFQHILYRFQDSSSGWNRIILPLNGEDGKQNSFGVLIDKRTEPGASWSNIIRMDFRIDEQNVAEDGNFYVDGFFFGKLLESDRIKFFVNSSHDITYLPNKVHLLPYFSKSQLSKIALYDSTGVPFILEKKSSATYDMYYVNAFPITEQIPSGDRNLGNMTALLGQILDPVPAADLPGYKFVKRSPSDLTDGGVAAFDRALFKGDLKAFSSSAIVNNSGEAPIDIIVDGTKSSLLNVSRIIPISIQNMTVQGTTGGILDNGYGFYSSLIMDQALITALGNHTTLLVERSKGDGREGETDIVTGKEIQMNLSKVSMLLRQPKVLSNGISELKDFYAYGGLHNNIPALGQDLMFKGKTSFNVDYADEFTIVNSASLDGKFLSGSISYPYDELANLSNIFSLPYARHIAVVIVLLVLVSLYVLEKRGTRDSNRESFSNTAP